MRQLWTDNSADPLYQPFNPNQTSIEQFIFTLDKKMARKHRESYKRAFALALDLPVLQ
jgi:hypothetical protein